MTMENRQPDESGWSACPAGEIGGLVGRLHARQRREKLRQVTAGVTCTVVLLVAGIYAWPRLGFNEPHFGGITCTEVEQQAEQYVENSLDAEATGSIEAHLARCKHCRDFVNELRANLDDRRADPRQAVEFSAPQHATTTILVAGNFD